MSATITTGIIPWLRSPISSLIVALSHPDRRATTYVSVLTRSHLRSLAPLPKEEFLALKRSIGELASIGRNINQIVKAANQGGQLPASVREEFRAMLKICVALRDNTKTLLQANINSWKSGHVEADL